MELFAKLQNKPFLLALLANSVVLVWGLWLSGWQYVSMDDFFMHSVLTGAYGGAYDVHLYFVNAIYGYFLWPFYKILPDVGWYSLFEKVTEFCSFVAISYVVLRKYGGKLGGIITVLIVSCVALDFFLYVEFTRCAAVATAAGIFLFAVGHGEKRFSYLLWGTLFLVVGYVFRKEMFLLGLPTLVSVLFFSALLKKSIWKGTVIAVAVLAAALFGVKTFDQSLYKSGGYEYYAAYQGSRAFFGDGAFYDFKDFSDELEERGRSSRDARYLQAWYFYDNDVFSLDSINNLIKIAQRSAYEPNYLKFPFAVARCISESLMTGYVWCWLLLCFTIIYFSNKKCWWAPWVSLAIIGLSYTYLLLVNRVVPHVEAGIWIFAVIFVLFFVDKNAFIEANRSKGFVKIFLLVSLVGLANTITLFEFGKTSRLLKAGYSTQSDWGAFLDYANRNSNDVFLLPFGRYKELGGFVGKTYKAVAPGSWNNIHSTGYWNIHLPPLERELEKRGVTNLFRDIKNDNVFVLNDKQALSFVPFYKEHYHEDLAIDTIRTFGNLFLLKYRVKELTSETETP